MLCRGLRLAVNQQGEGVYSFGVNTLTIMANENYKMNMKKMNEGSEFMVDIK